MNFTRNNKNNKIPKFNKSSLKDLKPEDYPFVSVCTPTFNRRPFIEPLIECFKKQDYPEDKMEWIIVDDGSDKIEDLVYDIPQVKYIKLEDKVTLGKKRNIMNREAKGEFFVYMDDDDYYPEDRVSHGVETLLQNPEYLIAGCDKILLYYGEPENMLIQIGPYRKNHATAATFVFRKELLNNQKYDENKSFGEETSFLNRFTVPLIQLDGEKTIVVFAHRFNSIDKRFILNNKKAHKVVELKEELSKYIKNDIYRNFVLTSDNILKEYELGKLEYKKDIYDELEKKKKINKQNQEKINNVKDDLEKFNKNELKNIIINMRVKELALKKRINFLETGLRKKLIESQMQKNKDKKDDDKESMNDEIKDEIKDENKDDIQETINDKIKEDIQETINDKIKDDIKDNVEQAINDKIKEKVEEKIEENSV